jgi:hypothetical protein
MFLAAAVLLCTSSHQRWTQLQASVQLYQSLQSYSEKLTVEEVRPKPQIPSRLANNAS